MPRLQAEPDRSRWVPVTDSLGFHGRRHRKAAIGMLLQQASGALGTRSLEGGGFTAWAMSQAVPLLCAGPPAGCSRGYGRRILSCSW